MIKQGGGGRIINITSVHEDWPMPGNTAYCLSKGGCVLTRTAGVELAPHNILVVGVGPGAVATPINRSTMNDPGLLEKLDGAIPMGRMGGRKKSPAWSYSSQAPVPATSPQPLYLPTGVSCIVARACNPTRGHKAPGVLRADRRLRCLGPWQDQADQRPLVHDNLGLAHRAGLGAPG